MVEFCFPLSPSNGAPAAQEKFGDPSESEPLGAAEQMGGNGDCRRDRGALSTSTCFKKLRLCTSYDQFFFLRFCVP